MNPINVMASFFNTNMRIFYKWL